MGAETSNIVRMLAWQFVPPRNKRRRLIFVAVAGAHAAALAALLSMSRSISLSSPTTIPLMAFVLTQPARPHPPIARQRLDETPARPIVEPITVVPPALSVRASSGPAIDWSTEATRSVAKILAPGKQRLAFGFPQRGESAITLGVPSRSTPHYAGESYRLDTGEAIVWTSDHCYLVSDPPSLFAPTFLQNARVTRMMCR